MRIEVDATIKRVLDDVLQPQQVRVDTGGLYESHVGYDVVVSRRPGRRRRQRQHKERDDVDDEKL